MTFRLGLLFTFVLVCYSLRTQLFYDRWHTNVDQDAYQINKPWRVELHQECSPETTFLWSKWLYNIVKCGSVCTVVQLSVHDGSEVARYPAPFAGCEFGFDKRY